MSTLRPAPAKSGLLPGGLDTPLVRLERYSIEALRDVDALRGMAQTIPSWEQHPGPALRDRQERARLRIASEAAVLHLKADAVLDAMESPAVEDWWVDLWVRAGERNAARVKALAERSRSLTVPGRSIAGKASAAAIPSPAVFADGDQLQALPALAQALRDPEWSAYARRLRSVAPGMAEAYKAARVPLSIPQRLDLVRRTSVAVIDAALFGL